MVLHFAVPHTDCTKFETHGTTEEPGDRMRMSETLVCGTYSNEAALEYALCHLRNVGFLDANFTVLLPEESFNNTSKVVTKLTRGPSSCHAIRSGGFLLWIQCDSAGQALVAKKILEGTEAEAVSSSSETQLASETDSSTRFRNLA